MITIALHTFRSLLREKIIFNVFGVTLLMLFFGYLASLLVFGHQERVMIDLGVTVNSLSIFCVAVGIGARFIRQDLENKTIYLVLVRPVSRSAYYAARMLGAGLFITLNFLILSLILFLCVQYLSGVLSAAFFQSFLLTLLEAFILLGASAMASFWMRPAVVFMFMFAMVFLGHNHALIQSQEGISLLSRFTPDLSQLLMSDRVYYQHDLSAGELLKVSVYGCFWLFFFLLLGNAVFSKKNL